MTKTRKQWQRRLLATFCALAMLCTLLPMGLSVAAADASGTCGDNLTWTLDSGTLTISGTGRIETFSNADTDPWSSYRNSITAVVIEKGITSIGSRIFIGYTALTSVVISDSVTIIGADVFQGCTSLTSVTIPEGVTRIDYGTFSGCTSLTTITIPEGITSIDYGAFSGCTSLSSIAIPDSVTDIASRAFYNTALYNDESNWKNGVLYIDRWAIEAQKNIETCVLETGTRGIADSAFAGCKLLTSITIPDGVTNIGYSSFSGCTSLSSITIPDSIINMSSKVFYNTALYNDENNWKDGVLYIDRWAIEAQKNVETCVIQTGTRGIADSVFDGGMPLTSITVPDGVTSIGGAAFYSCQELTSITIPDSVTYIGSWVFADCFSLTSITLPRGITSIGDEAFGNCYVLTSITIPDSVTSIGEWAFVDCSSLISITLPDGATSIGERAFMNCSSLISITIPDGVTSIGEDAFINCNSLTIYGKEGSYAQTYAQENDIPFVAGEAPHNVVTDGGVSVQTIDGTAFDNDVSLSVEEVSDETVADLLVGDYTSCKAFNITLKKGDAEIQPDGKVQVRVAVPAGMESKNCHIFRVEADGSLTDMNAYFNGYSLIFTTEHFSRYIVAEKADTPVDPDVLLGDVNGDGSVDTGDARLLLQVAAEIISLDDIIADAADVNGDSSIDTGDARLLLQYAAEIITKFPVQA